jgi:hypothetical protein
VNEVESAHVVHDGGHGAHGVGIDHVARAFGPDREDGDAERVAFDGVDALVARPLGTPGFVAHRFEELAHQALEGEGVHLEEVGAAVEAGDCGCVSGDAVAVQIELDDRGHGLKVVRVLGDQRAQVP